MKTNNTSLERCIEKLENSAKKHVIDPSIEVYAVNHLKDKKDILKFHRKYVKIMENHISSQIDRNKKTHATSLVERGYSLHKVASFFVHDGLMSTLGHIYNGQVLNAWYSSIPFMKSEFPKDMYQH